MLRVVWKVSCLSAFAMDKLLCLIGLLRRPVLKYYLMNHVAVNSLSFNTNDYPPLCKFQLEESHVQTKKAQTTTFLEKYKPKFPLSALSFKSHLVLEL